MGLYDTFGKIGLQLKLCNDGESMKDYSVGNPVPLSDGIYIGYEGAIVVKDGKFVAEFKSLTDKWGNTLSCREITEPKSPLLKALKDLGVPNQKKKER